MILKNFIHSIRNLLNNKGLSLVNLFGLSLGIMAFLIIYHYIRFEKSYDKHLVNNDRLYRTVFYRHYQTGLDKSVGVNYLVGQGSAEKIPEVEKFCRCRKETVFIEAGDEIYKEERVFFADTSFFDIFSYPVISGSRETFMREPNSVIVTESVARKYFGDINVIGKTIYNVNPGSKPFIIRGVVNDVPPNSHLKFDLVVPLSALTGDNYCYTCNNTNTYFLLKAGSDPAVVASKITQVASEYLKSINYDFQFAMEYHLQPVTEIHLNSNYRFEHEINGNNKYLSALFIVSIFILLSAFLNYSDLFTSLLRKRIKGIATKIINGASRTSIISELAAETFLTGLISLLIGISLFFGSFRMIRSYLDFDFSVSSLSNFKIWLVPSLILLSVSLIIGITTGLRIYRIGPLSIFKKNKINDQGKKYKKLIIALQFFIAMFLISSTILAIKQIRYMQHKALTMDIEQTLVVKRPVDRKFNPSQVSFQESLMRLPDIEEITYSTITPGEKNTWVKGGIMIKGGDKLGDQIYQTSVAPGFFDFFDIRLLAGRTFYDDETNWEGGRKHLVLNKEAALAMCGGSGDFAKILGQEVFDSDQNSDIGEIIGVVDGYFQNSLDQEVRPTIFNADQGGYYIYIKIRDGNIRKTVSLVKSEFQKHFEGQYFEYFFLDEYFNSQYKSHIQFNRCFILFSIMAIIIVILSLLGIVIIVCAEKTKEIGIRKVNGARVSEILTMLNKDFIVWVVIAFIIVTPFAWYAMQKWLQSFAYKTEITWWIFALTGIIILIIALLTVSWQSWRAATRNPVEALRYE